jgi:hypothetical protein
MKEAAKHKIMMMSKDGRIDQKEVSKIMMRELDRIAEIQVKFQTEIEELLAEL